MGLERAADGLFITRDGLIEVKPSGYRATTRVSIFILPGQHQKAGAFAGGEQTGFAIQLRLRGPGATFRGRDSLLGRLNRLQGVTHLRLDQLSDASLFELQLTALEHRRFHIRMSRPIAGRQVQRNARLERGIISAKQVTQRLPIATQ